MDAGIWVVGQDIPEGIYDISAYITKNYGNFGFSIIDQSGNSILSLHGYGNDLKSASHIKVYEGNIIIADGCVAEMTISSDNIFFGN